MSLSSKNKQIISETFVLSESKTSNDHIPYDLQDSLMLYKPMHISQHYAYKSNYLSMDYHSTRSLPDFQTFLQGWMTRLELYLQQLLHLLKTLDQQDESKLEQLIHQVMTHYHEYFIAKAEVCHENVFLVLSPPWFSSYERTFQWLAGFKPSFAIYIVKSCGVDFSPDQAARIERLVTETKDKEHEITARLAILEEQVIAPPMLALARLGGKEVNGMKNEVDTVVDRLAEDLELLVGCADYLREKTVAKVVGMLTTAQTVRFLAAMVRIQLRIRRWGQLWEREPSRRL